MRPVNGEVLHFSEDPNITEFVPHVARTSSVPDEYVWAVGRDRSPDYWFPRECPRALSWVEPTTTASDRDLILGASESTRVHVIEYEWLEIMRTVRLFAYRLPANDFQPIGEPVSHALVTGTTVRPLGPPELVGDLFKLHEDASIELRIVKSLWPFWDVVVNSSMGFSGIRLANARPR